jgi:[ribosomal protein S18]-alanine N-acetyltransferase
MIKDSRGVIRYATEEDLKSTGEIERLSFPHPWDYDYQKAALKDLFLIYEDGGVLGYLIAVCYHQLSKAMIMKIAVHPDHRGQGIAGELLGKIVEVLRRAGIAEVEIDAKMIGKGPVALYERFGFRVARTVSLDDEAEDVYFHTMILKLAERKGEPPEPSCPANCPCPGLALEDEGGPA